MNYKNCIELEMDEIRNFLYHSKIQCFARTDIKTSSSDGSSMYSNRELPWLYTDTYCCNTIERGTEDIYYDMVLIWSMQYRGGILREFWSIAEAISRFLKHALLALPLEFPIRGPKCFNMEEFEFEDTIYEGSFQYRNNWEGDFEKFIGKETIVWDGQLAFYHDYIGGFVRNKYFPIKINGSNDFD